MLQALRLRRRRAARRATVWNSPQAMAGSAEATGRRSVARIVGRMLFPLKTVERPDTQETVFEQRVDDREAVDDSFEHAFLGSGNGYLHDSRRVLQAGFGATGPIFWR